MTDREGHASVRCSPADCVVTAKLAGYQTIEIPVQAADGELSVALVKKPEHSEAVTVQAERQWTAGCGRDWAEQA